MNGKDPRDEKEKKVVNEKLKSERSVNSRISFFSFRSLNGYH